MSATVREHLRCPACQYDLFGLTESRCPECGRPFDLKQVREWASASWWSRYVAPFGPPAGTGLLIFFSAVNLTWIPAAGHMNPSGILSGVLIILIPCVLLYGISQVMFGRTADRRIAALVYLGSLCAVLLLVHDGSYNTRINVQGAWLLWSINVYAWILIAMLLTKASIIWELRDRYARGWRNSFAFVVYLIILTLGAAFVIHAYAANETNLPRFPRADVIGQFWGGALGLTLVDSALGLLFVPLAQPLAHILGVPLNKPIRFTLLFRDPDRAKHEWEPEQGS